MMPKLVQAEWSDAPHLTEKDKEELLSEIPASEREARTKGIPMLGAGRIYPYPEDGPNGVFIEPFDLPQWWPRAYGLDVGWNITAAVWGAWDRDSDIVYIYSEYYAGQQSTANHAEAIKARGHWMNGAIDPAAESMVANMKDGQRVMDEYLQCGCYLLKADNAVYAGITACQNRFQSGRLKIFNTCRNVRSEYRVYRTEKSQDGRTIKIVKQQDHAMDAMRYLIMTGMAAGTTPPDEEERFAHEIAQYGRNETTGY